MGKGIFIEQEAERVDFGVMEDNVFHWEHSKQMPIGWSNGVLKAIEEEGEDTDLEPELKCMGQIRNPMRELQCREARGERVRESRWHFLLEADWPTIIIGMWMYMFPFLIGFAAVVFDRVW